MVAEKFYNSRIRENYNTATTAAAVLMQTIPMV
jgi:hypothetical protein